MLNSMLTYYFSVKVFMLFSRRYLKEKKSMSTTACRSRHEIKYMSPQMLYGSATNQNKINAPLITDNDCLTLDTFHAIEMQPIKKSLS